MRLGLLWVMAGGALLSGCGSSTGPTLMVRCETGTALVGATSIDVSPDTSRGAVLKFPDPVNSGQTGTINIAQGKSCKITSNVNS